jgi:hypothetical protein
VRIARASRFANLRDESKGEANVKPGDHARSEIPEALERAEVPLYFRQFRDATVLKKMAYARKGPKYQIIGRSAWYDTADIRAWLETRKSSGPQQHATALSALAMSAPVEKRRRGRPTKTEQRRRELERQAAAALSS